MGGYQESAEEQWKRSETSARGRRAMTWEQVVLLLSSMFPTSKLFSGTLCPDYTSCRLQPCLFNHSPPVAIVGVRAPEASTSALPQPARPGVPQKRPGAPANEGALKSSKTAAGGVPARPVASGSGTSSSSSRPTAAGPTSAARPPPPASTSYTARKPLVDVGGSRRAAPNSH